jgi:hypothetical protein
LLEFTKEKKTKKNRGLNITTHAHEMMMQTNKQDLVLNLDLHLNKFANQHTTQFGLARILE